MVIVGIDPGVTGGIFANDLEGGTWIWDIPVMVKSSGKGNQINPYGLFEILNVIKSIQHREEHVVYLENVNAMPGQGVTSVFSFGRSVGIIEGVVASLGYRLHMISPMKWKKAAGLTGKEKDAARTMAIQLYPSLANKLTRKKDIGRADAILIGHFGHKINESN
jgi:crossover junction endodeoxyribonuclease RuvC